MYDVVFTMLMRGLNEWYILQQDGLYVCTEGFDKNVPLRSKYIVIKHLNDEYMSFYKAKIHVISNYLVQCKFPGNG